MGRIAGACLRRLACHRSLPYPGDAHIWVGFMPRPLPANSGRVQGRLCRSRQLSRSSAILEVPCRSSANCVIKPATANTGNAGTVAAPCCRPRTKVQLDALRNTFVHDAKVAKMFPRMSWLLVGSATAGVTGENCRRHRKTIRGSCATGFPRGVGSLPRRPQCPEFSDMVSAFGGRRLVP
jgi:hypothetical protein